MRTNWFLTAVLLASAVCLWNELRTILVLLARVQPDFPPRLDLLTVTFQPHGVKEVHEISLYGLLLLPASALLSAIKNMFLGKKTTVFGFLLFLVAGITVFAHWSLTAKLSFIHPGDLSQELISWTELGKYSFEAEFAQGPIVRQTLGPLAAAYTFFMLVFSWPFYTQKKKRGYTLPPL